MNHLFWPDPNEGKILAPGTIPSEEIPEDKLVFTGDLASLYRILGSYVLSHEDLADEKKFIEKLDPYSETNSWDKSVRLQNNPD
ncbi:MAG: hypothetical protein AMS27_13935 [Bacteroides sp. SM23_62_1]|nr:MAG: hypothetical protein AMS27_13935 [Bacteroides sp. SM23_62_1]